MLELWHDPGYVKRARCLLYTSIQVITDPGDHSMLALPPSFLLLSSALTTGRDPSTPIFATIPCRHVVSIPTLDTNLEGPYVHCPYPPRLSVRPLQNRSEVEIDIILSPKQAQRFRDRINKDGTDAHAIDEALAHVQSENAEASVQANLDAIRVLIQKYSGGFGTLNDTVKQYLRRWFVSQGGVKVVAHSGNIKSDRQRGSSGRSAVERIGGGAVAAGSTRNRASLLPRNSNGGSDGSAGEAHQETTV